MMLSFCIPYPKTKAGRSAWNKEFGMNAIYAGKHWSARNRDADFWHQTVRYAIMQDGMRPKMMEKPVQITYRFDDKMDSTNHGYMVKLIEDGLKGIVIKDDSKQFVKRTVIEFHDRDCIEVEVAEIE